MFSAKFMGDQRLLKLCITQSAFSFKIPQKTTYTFQNYPWDAYFQELKIIIVISNLKDGGPTKSQSNSAVELILLQMGKKGSRVKGRRRVCLKSKFPTKGLVCLSLVKQCKGFSIATGSTT